MGVAATTKPLLRTFIAIDLPRPSLDAIAAEQTRLEGHLSQSGLSRGLSWSPPGNIHLTLRFLGDTALQQRHAIIAGLQSAAASWRPFELAIAGLGGFPSLRRPRVIWVGLDGDLAALNAMQAAVEALAQAAGLPAEEKGFSPHLTLARGRRDASPRMLAEVGQAVERYTPAPPPPPFSVDRVVYYHSDLRPSGAVYAPLAVVPFAAA
jgi:2'-5' RNA ligase